MSHSRPMKSVTGSLACLLIQVSAAATTVVDFTIEDLIRWSHACVRVRIENDPSQVAIQPSIRLARPHPGGGSEITHMVVEDVVYGSFPDYPTTLSIPSSIEGAPRLATGVSYLLFINFDNRIEPILGHQWGVYRVAGDSMLDFRGQPLVVREEEARDGRQREHRLRKAATSDSLSYAQLRALILAFRDSIIQEGFIPLVPDQH